MPSTNFGGPSTTTYTRYAAPITSLPAGTVPSGSTGHYSYSETTTTTNNVTPYSLPYQPATRIISQSPVGVGGTTIPSIPKYDFTTTSGTTSQNPSFTSNLPPITSYTGSSIPSGATTIYTTGLPSGLTAGSSFPSGATYGQSYFTTTSTTAGGDPSSLLNRQAPSYSYTNTTTVTSQQQNTTATNAPSGDANVAAITGSNTGNATNSGNVQSVTSSNAGFQSAGSATSGTNIYPVGSVGTVGATNFQGSASGAGTYQSSGTSNTGMFQNPAFQSGLTNLVAPNPTIKSFTNMVSTSGDG